MPDIPSRPIADYESHVQAKLVKFRMENAKRALVRYDKPSESELEWVLETLDSVLTLMLSHVAECERDWTPKAPEAQ